MAEDKQCPCEPLLRTRDKVDGYGVRLHEGDIAMAQINLKLETIEKKVDKLELIIDKKFEIFYRDIEELKMKPAKRWDGLMTIIMTLVVGVMFGVLFAQMGIK